MPNNCVSDGLPTDDRGTESNPRELRGNALGLLSTAALTAAYMGPALSIYVLFQPMTNIVGQGVGFVLIIATVVTLLSAISFGLMAREMPSAGGIYSWTRAALGDGAGLCIGLNTIFYYFVCLIFAPIAFGQNFNAVLEQFGIAPAPDTPACLATLFLGAMLMFAIAAWVAYRGIVVSAHLAFTMLMIEIAVIVALAISFVAFAVSHNAFTLAPIKFSACKDSWKGIFLAMNMALMCTVCDAAVPAGEETENARRTIPIAVILTLLLVGIWYVFGFSAFAMMRPLVDVPANSTDIVVPAMAKAVWGWWNILVPITTMTAALGAFIPVMTAFSRMTFAMGREGKLPTLFAKLHPKYLAPWNAIHLAFVLTLLSMVPVFFYGPNMMIEWWGYISGWTICVVYATVNIVNIAYFLRVARSKFHPILNFAVPVVGFVVQVVVMVWSGIITPWQAGMIGRTSQAFVISVTVLSVIYSIYMRNHTFTTSGEIVEGATDASLMNPSGAAE